MFDAFARIDGGGDGISATDDRAIDQKELEDGWASVITYPLEGPSVVHIVRGTHRPFRETGSVRIARPW